MYLPIDAQLAMSTNLRKHWQRRLSGDVVATADEAEVETLMNARGWGWCSAHNDWHPLSTEFIGDYAKCPRFKKPFVPSDTSHVPPGKWAEGYAHVLEEAYQQTEGRWTSEAQKSKDSRSKSEEMEKAREYVKKLEMERKRSGTPNPFSPENWPDAGKSQKQQQEEFAKDMMEKLAKQRQEQDKAAQTLKERFQKLVADAAAKKKQEQQSEAKRRNEKKWLKKLYTRCPDCAMEACTHTWVKESEQPQPLDEADRISYAVHACGCTQLKGIKNPAAYDDDIPF